MEYPRKKSHAGELLKQRQKKNNTTKIVAIAVIIAIVAVGYALFVHFGEKEIPTEMVSPPGEEIRSIAVLAFEDMTSGENMEHVFSSLAERTVGMFA